MQKSLNRCLQNLRPMLFKAFCVLFYAKKAHTHAHTLRVSICHLRSTQHAKQRRWPCFSVLDDIEQLSLQDDKQSKILLYM